METKIINSTNGTEAAETSKRKGIFGNISKKNLLYYAKLYSGMALAFLCVFALSGNGFTVFAVDNDATTFNTVVAFIVTWVQRIGYVIAFLGAVQFGLAFKNDDADGKQRGLMTLASGFIVVAICIAYDQLFKSGV